MRNRSAVYKLVSLVDAKLVLFIYGNKSKRVFEFLGETVEQRVSSNKDGGFVETGCVFCGPGDKLDIFREKTVGGKGTEVLDSKNLGWCQDGTT